MNTIQLGARTKALTVFQSNLDSIMHLIAMSSREIQAVHDEAERVTAEFDRVQKPPQVQAIRELVAEFERLLQGLATARSRMATANLWKVVALVTAVEAYLQDLLSSAAAVDPSLMEKSKQEINYANVISAGSIETLAGEMRANWAAGRLGRGGPAKWIEQFERMGARGYPSQNTPSLERMWGTRHLIVHGAGVITPEFLRRHPHSNYEVGDRVKVTNDDLSGFLGLLNGLVDPTEAYFLARYPQLNDASGESPATGG